MIKQKEDRQKRDRRRQLAEAAEIEKENHRNAADGLIILHYYN